MAPKRDDESPDAMRQVGQSVRQSAKRLAAAAAATGDPAPLLELEASERDTSPTATLPPGGEGLDAWTHHTTWRQSVAAPVHAFLGTEASGAVLLLLAIVVALVWSNSPWGDSYFSFWSSSISVNLAGHTIGTDLRGAVNEGLMALFFLVVGLEAKRELDLGELRDRRRLTVPVLAAVTGIVASVLLYVAITAASGAGGGWGVAVSTDTALALGSLTLVTSGHGTRLRVFLLTLLVIDDLVSLLVITLVYPSRIHLGALVAAGLVLVVLLSLREYGRRHQDDENSGIALFVISVLVGFGLWLALFESGLDPVITGLAIGLLTSAYAPKRAVLERGSELTRSFRLDPSPERAHAATLTLTGAISPNERLQYRLHPWTSLVVVPIFALANAGLHIDSAVIGDALTSPITWGIVVAFTLGKPLGILSAAWITAKGAPRRGKLPVGWRELLGTANSAGVAFTVSLLIASRAFHGASLADAKLGVLMTVALAPLLAAVAFHPLNKRTGQDALDASDLGVPDLVGDVDIQSDHVLGDVTAPVTLTVYGSFGCHGSAAASDAARRLLQRFPGDLRYVYRHLPLEDVLPGAAVAAEATEAAGAQGGFWDMHDALADEPEDIGLGRIYQAARDRGLDLDRFFTELGRHVYAERVARDMRTADASGVTGTPALFINGYRYGGALDLNCLAAEVERRITPAGCQIEDARQPPSWP
jgi:Na+/H+ antiporter NhaA